MSLEGKYIKLIKHSNVGIKVRAKSVFPGMVYQVDRLKEGEPAYLKHPDKEGIYLMTTVVNKVTLLEDILEIKTQNTVYKFELLD